MQRRARPRGERRNMCTIGCWYSSLPLRILRLPAYQLRTSAARTRRVAIIALHSRVLRSAPPNTQSVSDLADVFGLHRYLAIGRELTKLFENIHVCPLGNAVPWLEANPNNQKGEFVLILAAAEPAKEDRLSDQTQRTLELLLEDLPLKQAVKLAADITGDSKNKIYSLALTLKSD